MIRIDGHIVQLHVSFQPSAIGSQIDLCEKTLKLLTCEPQKLWSRTKAPSETHQYYGLVNVSSRYEIMYCNRKGAQTFLRGEEYINGLRTAFLARRKVPNCEANNLL
jgi:hypothetical protein